MSKRFIGVLLALFVVLGLTVAGCSVESESSPKDKAKESGESFEKSAYVPPPGNTEQRNYNKAQELYNNPTTIIWCSAFPQSSTAPIITVPIAGKLTSSSTTAFSPDKVYNGDGDSNPVVAERSVDGLFHPNPPPYRYGFTPGGQLVDFTDMPTICTTQPLEFQKTSVEVSVDTSLDKATKEAEQALESGDAKKAQDILKGAASGS